MGAELLRGEDVCPGEFGVSRLVLEERKVAAGQGSNDETFILQSL